jgi:hypothetical protein
MQGHFRHLHFKTFPRYKEHFKARCFDPCNQTLIFLESWRIPKSPFRECECHLHTPSKWGCNTRFSFYTLTIMLLVLVLFLTNLIRNVRNMLSPMHLEATKRLRATTFHTRGNVLLLYGLSYISGPIFMASSSLYIPTTSISSGW